MATYAALTLTAQSSGDGERDAPSDHMLPVGIGAGDLVVITTLCADVSVGLPPEWSDSLGSITTGTGTHVLSNIYAFRAPYDITSESPGDIGVSAFQFTLFGFDMGILSFLYIGFQITAYRGVKSVRTTLTGSGSGDFTNLPAHVGAPTKGPLGYEAALMIVNSTNGTVAGHPEEDLNLAWGLRGWNQQGRTAVSHYTWRSADPNDDLLRVAPDASIVVSGTTPRWGGLSVALRLETLPRPPVVRQYPRDSRGLAAAARIHPPPRSNRLVGGHQ